MSTSLFYEWHLIYLNGARLLKLYCVNILWFSLNFCYIAVYVDVFYVNTVYATEYWYLLMFEMLFQVPIPLTYAAMVNCLFITCIYMTWKPISYTLTIMLFILAKILSLHLYFMMFSYYCVSIYFLYLILFLHCYPKTLKIVL